MIHHQGYEDYRTNKSLAEYWQREANRHRRQGKSLTGDLSQENAQEFLRRAEQIAGSYLLDFETRYREEQ
jgi:hypothetical protein